MLRFLLAILVASVASAQIPTAPVLDLHSPVKRLIAYVNCTAVPEPGRIISNAVVIVRNSQILAVGEKLQIPQGADVRDLKGAWVYPGFIDAFVNVKALQDGKGAADAGSDDEGPVTPPTVGARHWNQAVRPEGMILDRLQLSNDNIKGFYNAGFTTASVSSHDGIFSGYASVISLHPGPVTPYIIEPRAAQTLGFEKGTSKTPYPTSLMGSIALLRQTFFDAVWYAESMKKKGTPTADIPEINVSLEALASAVHQDMPFVAAAQTEHDVARWLAIAEEAGIQIIVRGSGKEYRRLADIAALKPALILPLNLPAVPDVRDPIAARDVPLTDLIHWYWAPDNPRLLDSAGCTFAFTSNGCKDPSEALANLQSMVKLGLDSVTALAALTTVPARMLRADNTIGTIAPGKLANLTIFSKPCFTTGTQVHGVVVNGEYITVNPVPAVNTRGTWTLSTAALLKPLTITIGGSSAKPSVTVVGDSGTTIPSAEILNNRLTFTIQTSTLGLPGTARVTATLDSIMMRGTFYSPNGTWAECMLQRRGPDTTKQVQAETSRKRLPLPPTIPLGPFGYDQQPKQLNIVLKNATVWTCDSVGILYNTDVAISGGKIVGIGKGLSGASTIDCSGKHITPGIIDEHSHIAISRGVNEGAHAVTSEVRIGDVLNPDDINIYRQLAGGVTFSHALHGSANPIGGQTQPIRMRWGANAEGLKQDNATPTIKFALGENVKQSNWGDDYVIRYPQSRMGVEEIMRDAFAAAREYEQRCTKASVGGLPVRRDLQLDALVEVLNGKRNVHCHSYKQSEILMLIRLAEEFGFTVSTFTHILEGYKVASELKQHGAHVNTFSDWWAYKFEVYDAIPQNAAIMHEQGLLVGINSDDAEMGRRLNQEAGKSVSYGGVAETDALKFVTVNPAIQMNVNSFVGTLKNGMDADVVVWSANPLSNMAKVEHTFVEGRELFSIDADAILRARDAALRSTLEQEALTAIARGGTPAATHSQEDEEYHCDTITDEMRGGE